ncbi:hypothetical protein [Chitinophaga qingshengii]|uniref:Uncharacterized protein n=1 Tax=Chitinophaga qingshengii TaxID=1569794 RepID=A0ABR7TRG5_9BACT|nr:hypothetical protein [Chitinophaga qingshengii]MBC9932215.1 hypothetical protein [Chitinophaga qingshengii]
MRNDPLTTKDQKLHYYATIAARLDEQFDMIVGRGAFTEQTLTPQAIHAWTNDNHQYQALNEPWAAVTQHLPQNGTTSALPAYVPSTNNQALPVIRFLSLVYDLFLPFHAMLPLAQRVKQSAVVWYISGNSPEGIQVCLSSLRQAIDVRYNRRLQYTWSCNRAISLPVSGDILSFVRIIFRILKLPPGDDHDDEPLFLTNGIRLDHVKKMDLCIEKTCSLLSSMSISLYWRRNKIKVNMSGIHWKSCKYSVKGYRR